jgi:hypothetical protein
LKIMVDTSAPHSTRVRAVDSVLDHSAKAIEIEDIEARVLELERAAEQGGRQTGSTWLAGGRRCGLAGRPYREGHG